MITKIFYSLVLFPDIQYHSALKSGYGLSDIVEEWFWKFRVVFRKWDSLKKIYFTHMDFIWDEEWLRTQNWLIYWDSQDLVSEIYDQVTKNEICDFNFFKKKSFYDTIPFWVVLTVTSKCNLFCNYCFNDYDYPLKERNTRKTLNFNEFKRIIDELYTEWTRDIIITWWEPFLYENFWELLEYLKQKWIFIRINTNGTLLSEDTLRKLNDHYSVSLLVSMHEFNGEDYFWINKEWALNIYWIDLKQWTWKFLEKVGKLKSVRNYENITLDFLTILTPKNIVHLEKIWEYVLNNFTIENWHFFRLYSTHTWPGISRSMINLAIHKIYKLNQIYKTDFKIVDSVPFCVTKNTEIARKVIDGELSEHHNIKTIITTTWEVQIMSAFDSNLWNIFDTWIRHIWQWEFVQKMLNNWFLPKDCYDCVYKEECRGWSRMDANIYNGSYEAWDPLWDVNNKKLK